MYASATGNTPPAFTNMIYSTTAAATNGYVTKGVSLSASLVVFVQDEDTKEIVQSQSIAAEPGNAVTDISSAIQQVVTYPNPASDNIFIDFATDRKLKLLFPFSTLPEIKSVTIRVFILKKVHSILHCLPENLPMDFICYNLMRV